MPRPLRSGLVLLAVASILIGPAAADDATTCAQGSGDTAIGACDRLIASGKGTRWQLAAYYYNRGVVYLEQGKYDRAIADFNEAIRLNPKYALAYNERGLAYGEKGEYDRAISDFSDAIRLHPKDAFANEERAVVYSNRGRSYLSKNDYDRAIADFNEAIRLNPKDPHAYNERGLLYTKKNDYDRAIAEFTEAIRLDPKYFRAYINRGALYSARGYLDQAVADLNEAIRLAPGEAGAYARRGRAYGRKGEYDRAISDFSEAIRLDPKAAAVYSSRGFVYTAKNDYDRAIADLSEAIRLAPKNADSYAHRGDALRKKGELDRAMQDIEAAIRLDPKYPYAYTYRGLLYEDKGKHERARAEFSAALALPLPIYASTQAHDIARERLAALPTIAAAAPATAVVAPVAVPTTAATTSPADVGRRVALIIGNGNYRHSTQLANPANDASDIAGALRKLGFELVEGRDLDKRGTEQKLREFSRKLAGAKLALFFYAGHGMQVAGKNYLVPVDAKLEQPSDLRLDTVELSDVLAQMEAEQRVNLVFLDACRDNPLARSFARSLGARSTSVAQGLTMVQSAIGTMIAYATQPDAIALDGDGRNSPFTAALLKHVATPGIDISTVMRRVRAEVIAVTHQRQVPWDHSSLVGDVVLVR